MPFQGDNGWFYLSARDMLLTGKIPLLSIASSHPWLHQGPYWTYMLGIGLFFFRFNPIVGGYITALIGVATTFLIFMTGKILFSGRVGIIASLLYATFPLAVIHDRFGYHTSPIPFFTLLFIGSLYRFLKGDKRFFPVSLFLLGILYNFELATTVFWTLILFFLFYGIWKKKSWALVLNNPKLAMISVFSFLIPMFPIILYDIQNNFTQTGKFFIWINYHIAAYFGYSGKHTVSVDNTRMMLEFFARYYRRLVFLASFPVSMLLLLIPFGWFIYSLYDKLRRKRWDPSMIILFLWIAFPLSGFFVTHTPSEAYIPIFFPAVSLVIALFLSYLYQWKKFRVLSIILLSVIALSNSYSLFANNFLMGTSPGYGATFKSRLDAAKKIVSKAKGKPYSLKGKGDGSEFESFTMNYQYLTWMLGNPPRKGRTEKCFTVSETSSDVFVESCGRKE